jgi:hypothetical protein
MNSSPECNRGNLDFPKCAGLSLCDVCPRTAVSRAFAEIMDMTDMGMPYAQPNLGFEVDEAPCLISGALAAIEGNKKTIVAALRLQEAKGVTPVDGIL